MFNKFSSINTTQENAFSISCLDDLQEIGKLNPTELTSICENNTLQQQIVNQLSDIQTFVLFVSKTPMEQLKIVLAHCGRELTKKLCTSGGSCVGLLMPLDAERCQLVYQMIKEKLPELIDHSLHLIDILKLIPLETREELCAVMKEKLPEIIEYRFQLSKILKLLSKKQSQDLFDFLKEKLAKITAFTDLCNFLDLFPREKHYEIFTILQNKKDIIKKSNLIVEVLTLFNPEQQEIIWDNIAKNGLSKIIWTDFKLLIKMLSLLSPEQRMEELFAVMAGQFPKIELSSQIKSSLLELFTPEQQPAIVCELIKKCRNHINWENVEHFIALLELLTPEQCIEMCEEMKEILPNIIKNSSSLKKILKICSPEQQWNICSKVKIIWMTGDFIDIFNNLTLTLEQSKVFCKSIDINNYQLIDILEGLIPNKRGMFWESIDSQKYYQFQHIVKILHLLTPEQHPVFCVLFKNSKHIEVDDKNNIQNIIEIFRLLDLQWHAFYYESTKEEIAKRISSVQDFIGISKVLSLELRQKLFEANKERILQLIGNSRDFMEILKSLSPKQWMEVIQVNKKWLADLSIDNVMRIFMSLPPEQQIIFCKLINGNAPSFDFSPQSFLNSITLISPPIRLIFCELKKESLPHLIANNKSFIEILTLLPIEQRIDLCKWMKDSLPKFFYDYKEFTEILELIAPAHRLVLCELMKERLSDSTYHVNDFIKYLNVIAPEQQSGFCELMKGNLIRMIKNFRTNDVSPEQQSMYEAMKEHLPPQIIREACNIKSLLECFSPKQRNMVCEATKEKLSEILPKIDKKFAYELFKDIPEIIKQLDNIKTLDISILSMDDWKKSVKLEPAQFASLCKDGLIQRQMANVIPDIKTFALFLQDTPVEQLKILLQNCSWILGWKLVKSVNHVKELLITLDKEHWQVVWKELELKTLVKNHSQMKLLLQSLPIEQHNVVFEKVKNELSQIINDTKGILDIMEVLSTKQRIELFKIMKENLHQFIWDDGFRDVLTYIAPEERKAFFEVMEAKIPRIFWRDNVFIDVFKLLSPEQEIVFYKSLKENLPETLKNVKGFIDVYKSLSPEQGTVFCELIKEQIPQIIENSGLNSMSLFFTSKEDRIVEQAIKERKLSYEFIKNACGIKKVLQFLSSKERLLVCNAMKEKIVELNQVGNTFTKELFQDIPEISKFTVETSVKNNSSMFFNQREKINSTSPSFNQIKDATMH